MVITDGGAQACGSYENNFLQDNYSKMWKLTRLQYSLWKNSVYYKFVVNLLCQRISTACKKFRTGVGVLMRMRNLISKLSIYKTAILPYLTYCSLVGCFCNGSDKRKLERVNEPA